MLNISTLSSTHIWHIVQHTKCGIHTSDDENERYDCAVTENIFMLTQQNALLISFFFEVENYKSN